ncbi:ImmA/IrrE family metallo-endopeptidase [Lachnoclostridium phytofermentans]|uniref:ImmA/IrrE family metallo-endopeptidase n=1 Tax=Lachnoclostridium phytofermentans TaxID=66219 RepID=UPI0004DF309B|nr:ImmA/IrrE family metallo-endopeptidase [Lachnoclostridium phytofermentans]
MTNNEIIAGTLSVFKECSINNFPIDCWDIINQYGYKVKRYSELKPKKQEACMGLSDDANIIGDTVYYNESKSTNRIRFSLMHELGHVILKSDNESECDKFASHIIAPRIAIHYSKCKNAIDVTKIFILSDQASRIAFDDYRRWRRIISIYGMSAIDKQMYEHFYNEDAQKFVWTFDRCDFCYTNDTYNGDVLCDSCKLYEIRKNIHTRRTDYQEHDLDIARSRWLYGNL